MQQDSHRPNKPAAHQAPLKSTFVNNPAIPSPRPQSESRKSFRGIATDSLTAKLLDYHAWWNLPRSRKTHT